MSFLLFPFSKDSASKSSTPNEESKSSLQLDAEARRIIEKLINSFQTSSLLSDKRDSAQNLLGYSRKFPNIIGEFGFTAYFSLFASGIQDSQLISNSLQILHNVLKSSANLTKEFIHFLEEGDNFAMLVQLLTSFDQDHVIVECMLNIFLAILECEGKAVVALINKSNGISLLQKFCDFLKSENDVLFVESANLLVKLSSASDQIQYSLISACKLDDLICNYLERISLNKIRYETVYYLEMLKALLLNNCKNLLEFTNSGYLLKVATVFVKEVNTAIKDSTWTVSTCKNFITLISILISFVDSDGDLEASIVAKNQAMFSSLNFMHVLTYFALNFTCCSGDICINSMLLFAHLIRNNEANCSKIDHIKSSIMIQDVQVSISFMDALIKTIFMKEKELTVEFILTSLYFVECYFSNHLEAQLAFISTLIPSPESSTSSNSFTSEQSIGNFLLTSLFDFESLTLQKDSMKGFISAMVFYYMIRNNPAALTKVSSFPVTIDFIRDFQNEVQESTQHQALIPSIPQNILLALKNFSTTDLSPLVRLGYSLLLAELISFNSSLIKSLLAEYSLAEFLTCSIKQEDFGAFYIFLISAVSLWKEPCLNNFISFVTSHSSKRNLHKLFQNIQRSSFLEVLSAHSNFSIPPLLSIPLSFPIDNNRTLLLDAERIVNGKAPLITELSGKVTSYEKIINELQADLSTKTSNLNALIARVTELEDEQQLFLEQIGQLEDSVQKLKKSAKMSDILTI